MMANPPVQCHRQLVAFGAGEVVCETGYRLRSLEYLGDFAIYRAAHANVVSAHLIMDPDGEA
jgi:hypothetical protein